MRQKVNLLIVGSFLIIFIVAAFYLIKSGFFKIREVKVIAEKITCASPNDLRDASNLAGQNFLLVNSSEIKNELKSKYICVRDVTIKRAFPNRVILNIFAREPAAILVSLKSEEATPAALEKFLEATDSASPSTMSSGPNGSLQAGSAFTPLSEGSSTEFFIVDSEGIIYSLSFEQINAPKIYLGQNLTLGQYIGDLIGNTLKILEKIKNFGVDMKEAKIWGNALLINAIPRMIFSLDDKIDTQLASLQLILEQAKIDGKDVEFIDLRFDKPLVKLAPKQKNGER